MAKTKWEEKREAILNSASYRKAFDKALEARGDNVRCPAGHDLRKIENAHVGDLRRTGRITCDPCNRAAQERYAESKETAKARKLKAKKMHKAASDTPAPVRATRKKCSTVGCANKAKAGDTHCGKCIARVAAMAPESSPKEQAQGAAL